MHDPVTPDSRPALWLDRRRKVRERESPSNIEEKASCDQVDRSILTWDVPRLQGWKNEKKGPETNVEVTKR